MKTNNEQVEFQSTNCSEKIERVPGARVSIRVLRVVSMHRLDAHVAAKKVIWRVGDTYFILIDVVFMQSISRSSSIQLDVVGHSRVNCYN